MGQGTWAGYPKAGTACGHGAYSSTRCSSNEARLRAGRYSVRPRRLQQHAASTQEEGPPRNTWPRHPSPPLAAASVSGQRHVSRSRCCRRAQTHSSAHHPPQWCPVCVWGGGGEGLVIHRPGALCVRGRVVCMWTCCVHVDVLCACGRVVCMWTCCVLVCMWKSCVHVDVLRTCVHVFACRHVLGRRVGRSSSGSHDTSKCTRPNPSLHLRPCPAPAPASAPPPPPPPPTHPGPTPPLFPLRHIGYVGDTDQIIDCEGGQVREVHAQGRVRVPGG